MGWTFFYNYIFMNHKTIVAFDFDGTITKKDTLLEFIKYSQGVRTFYIGFMIYFPLLVAMKLKLYPNWKAKQQLFSYFFKNESVKKFDYLGDKYSDEIDKIVFPEAIEVIEEHKRKGHKVLIISASIENWMQSWANRNGIDLVIATKIEINEHGKLTGRFKSKNCYGQEKVNRLLELFPNRNEYFLVSYGDSSGDRELLNFSDKSYYKMFK